ncbi:hypothetical protein DSM104329_04814 [Capillimicrobium parvum]|uniref:Uncharacterized protein n=1 Tax=Capillimicrobium parvum TaxID=2884022 RepID=A0A9E6Y231_9ACTN|nr:hypothetical protein DSM104329_04814 [Capillimicrobium parvum]
MGRDWIVITAHTGQDGRVSGMFSSSVSDGRTARVPRQRHCVM